MFKYLSCNTESEYLFFSPNKMSIIKLGKRVIRSSIISSLITIISNSYILSKSVKDFRIITPTIFSLWTSICILFLGTYGGYKKNIPILTLLTIFSPMTGTACLCLTYMVSYIHLSLCLANPWSYKNCMYLDCIISDNRTFDNQCSLDELYESGCPILPSESCNSVDLFSLSSENKNILSMLSFCASLIPSMYGLLMIIRIENNN